MLSNVLRYRELLMVLVWKNIAVRYKQAYLGMLWALLKPVMLMLIFTLVRAFVGIDSGDIPYPILTFAALLPWTFFQEAVLDSTNSIVTNAHLIRKIYFPREIFPITSLLTKLVEFGVSSIILIGMMAYYEFVPTLQALWVPILILYTLLTALSVALAGAAINVYYRDVGQAVPIVLTLLMYASPTIYPLQLVKERLLEQQAAGDWSELLYFVYTLNPLAGIIDGFQNTLLRGAPPDASVIWPGLILVLVFLPLSYSFFKRAETHFADVI